jgi:hypothetical protein
MMGKSHNDSILHRTVHYPYSKSSLIYHCRARLPVRYFILLNNCKLQAFLPPYIVLPYYRGLSKHQSQRNTAVTTAYTVQSLAKLRMEHFFTQSRHLEEAPTPYGYTEMELAVPIQAFMNHRWDWSDFKAFATGDGNQMCKVMWITKDTLIWAEDVNSSMGQDFLRKYAIQRATFTTLSGERHALFLAKKRNSPSLPASATSIFWRAVTTSNCFKVKVNQQSLVGLWSGPDILQLWGTPSLELLKFEGVTFQETHCHTLATLMRTDLRVAFHKCHFYADGAEGALAEWLRHSKVVTKLEDCGMEDSVISALSGNRSVKSLSFSTTMSLASLVDIGPLARAFSYNQGIETLHVGILGMRLSDYMLNLLLLSLWAHPRLKSLSLDFNGGLDLSATSKTSIMNTVLRFARRNTVVETIDLSHGDDGINEEFFQNSILPRLEMNRNCFEDQRRSLTRADPSIRGKLLGRVLNVLQYNPDLLFRFLSENVPAFVRSDVDGPIIPTTAG